MFMHFDSNISLSNTLTVAAFLSFNEDSAMSPIIKKCEKLEYKEYNTTYGKESYT